MLSLKTLQTRGFTPTPTCEKKLVRGFTLVELLIAISIIGLMASITVVSVGNIRQTARDSKRLADIRQIQSGLELYFNTKNAYPLSNIEINLGNADHDILCANETGIVGDLADCAGVQTFMSRIPLNAQPGGDLYYKYKALPDLKNNGKPSAYEITFSLEVGIVGYTPGQHVARPSGIQ